MRGYTHINHGGGEECSIDLLTKEGPDAIVDWVFIELRDATNSDLVLATLSGLIQRDGATRQLLCWIKTSKSFTCYFFKTLYF